MTERNLNIDEQARLFSDLRDRAAELRRGL